MKAEYRAAGSIKLYEDHRNAWLGVTSGGIEDGGNASLAAMVIRQPQLIQAVSMLVEQFRPSLENGFMGGDVGCSGGSGGSGGAINISGIYSGASSGHGVTRGAVPNPLAVKLNPGTEFAGSDLHVSDGSYLERWAMPLCGQNTILQTRQYAHRSHRSLIVLEISLLGASEDCNISLATCARAASGMVQVPIHGDCNQSHGGTIITTSSAWKVSDPEQPTDPSFPRRQPAVVAIIAEAVPRKLQMKCGANINCKQGAGKSTAGEMFLAVVHTTLEDGLQTLEETLSKARSDMVHALLLVSITTAK
jgi:hypothetical protein